MWVSTLFQGSTSKNDALARASYYLDQKQRHPNRLLYRGDSTTLICPEPKQRDGHQPKQTKKMEMKNMSNEIENFLADLETDKGTETTQKWPVRDTLKVDRDALHKDYLLEGFTSGISGNYTVEGDDTTYNTAVRVIEPSAGRRQTFWLSGYEQEHLATAVSKALEGGHAYPMVVTFLRHQDQSKTGRTYNRFSIKVTDSAGKNDSLVVPPVPEDQFQD
ncbi:hypothetical protein N9L01_00120 [bacterium]|nr:hypothetical protein [bacterium]